MAELSWGWHVFGGMIMLFSACGSVYAIRTLLREPRVPFADLRKTTNSERREMAAANPREGGYHDLSD